MTLLLGEASHDEQQNVSGGLFARDRLIKPTACESKTTMVMSMVEPPDWWWRRRAGIDGRVDEEARHRQAFRLRRRPHLEMAMWTRSPIPRGELLY
jgi:hypothetical protein